MVNAVAAATPEYARRATSLTLDWTRHSWFMLAASVPSIPGATFVKRRSWPVEPKETVFGCDATEPAPIAAEFGALAVLPCPTANVLNPEAVAAWPSAVELSPVAAAA